MRSRNDILADILRQPERDDLRMEYADATEAKNPAYAKYIRTELAWPGSPLDARQGDSRVEHGSRTRSRSTATA